MRCIFCGHSDSRVVDSRPADDGNAIRRRRECINCQKRFTTYEKVETLPLMVIKKDGRREIFDANKIRSGILHATAKRPVAMADIDNIIHDIEIALNNTLEQEITSVRIGEMVMERLKDLDEVVYVRFASVYRSFRDIQTFMEELSSLLTQKPTKE